METKLIRLPGVMERVGLGRSVIYKRMAEGTFPRSIPIGGRLIAWDSTEIDRWIQEQIDTAKSSQSSDVNCEL